MLNGPGDVYAHVTYPMAVVTTSAGDERAGCLVGFHTQCSIDPARYLVCISVQNHTCDVASSAPALALHFLSRADAALASLFGEETGDAVDKFAQCAWVPGPYGVPLLQHDGSWIAGPIVMRSVVGDHQAMVIDTVYGGGQPPSPQLQYADVMEFRPGHPA